MSGSLKSSLRVSSKGETLSLNTVSSKVKRSKKWYGKIPAQVLMDERLSANEKLMFATMALFPFQGNIAYIGLRLLAELSGCSPATAMRRVNKLLACGHLEIAKEREAGKRTFYMFTSPVFGQKQRDGEKVIGVGPSGQPRMVSAPKHRDAGFTKIAREVA